MSVLPIVSLPKTMRGAFLVGPRQVVVRDVPVPWPGRGEVLVEVTTALTCGTELKAYRQGHRYFKWPMALGHEFVGLVAAVGEGIDEVQVGDRVVAANSAPCETCRPCQLGQTNLCRRLPDQLMFGAFADYLRIPAAIVRHNLLRVPAALPDNVAAFLEPFACVVHGNEVTAARRGESAVVIGGTGAIGLLFVQLLRTAGVAPLVAVGRKQARLALAKRLGATHAVDATDGSLVEHISEVIPDGADVVIEISGVPELIEQAVNLVRPGGRVVVFGGSEPDASAKLDLARVHYDEISLRGAFHHTPSTVRKSLDILTSGTIDVTSLVSGRLHLEDAAEAMRRFDLGDTFKLAIAPGGRPPAVGAT